MLQAVLQLTLRLITFFKNFVEVPLQSFCRGTRLVLPCHSWSIVNILNYFKNAVGMHYLLEENFTNFVQLNYMNIVYI